ncbi:MAG: hypothetical protein HKP19_14620, partial [Xanthomonadales bacterium]|nr:hypothetical protein [Xanthomonadales bacterium]
VNELLRLERPASNAVILADVDTTRLFAETLPRCLHDKSQALPVIYLTDYDTEYMRKEARRMGAVGYFRKPIDDQALLDSITFAVRQSKVRNAG